jgi:hypothetical protein
MDVPSRNVSSTTTLFSDRNSAIRQAAALVPSMLPWRPHGRTGVSPVIANGRLCHQDGLERTLTLQQSVVKVDNLSKATQSGIKSRFVSAADLVLQLASTHRHGRLNNYIRRAIQAPKLLIIDELGYLPFCREEATLLPGYRSPIASTGSVIITSNLLGMKYGSFQFE